MALDMASQTVFHQRSQKGDKPLAKIQIQTYESGFQRWAKFCEPDQFDSRDAMYLFLVNTNSDHVVGLARLRPSTEIHPILNKMQRDAAGREDRPALDSLHSWELDKIMGCRCEEKDLITQMALELLTLQGIRGCFVTASTAFVKRLQNSSVSVTSTQISDKSQFTRCFLRLPRVNVSNWPKCNISHPYMP